MPTTPIPDTQWQNVKLALCKRLGLKPDQIANIAVELENGGAKITWEGIEFMEAQEFLDIFNEAR